MPRSPFFTVAFDKIGRAKAEMQRLEVSLAAHQRTGFDDIWSRNATIAFAVHGAYTGIEDVMSDIAGLIDGSVPKGGASHQSRSIRALPGRGAARSDACAPRRAAACAA